MFFEMVLPPAGEGGFYYVIRSFSSGKLGSYGFCVLEEENGKGFCGHGTARASLHVIVHD